MQLFLVNTLLVVALIAGALTLQSLHASHENSKATTSASASIQQQAATAQTPATSAQTTAPATTPAAPVQPSIPQRTRNYENELYDD
jgi:archaellum component FlaG (FlaF/FlaG flagellin family)